MSIHFKILTLLRIFYLYIKQRHFFKSFPLETPEHIVLEVDRKYRHQNYFKLFNKKKNKDFLLINVFKPKEFTKIKRIPLKRLLYFFSVNYLNYKKESQKKLNHELLLSKRASSFSNFCYFSALFNEIKINKPETLVFHGGASFAAKASRDQGLKTYWIFHGMVDKSRMPLEGSDIIFVYSKEDQEFLMERFKDSEIRLIPSIEVRERLKVVIVFFDGEKEDTETLIEVLNLFKENKYKIIFKTHPTFLGLKEPKLYSKIRSLYGDTNFLKSHIDTEELLEKEKPSFVITWLSTAACISLRAGVIPICIEKNAEADYFKLPCYPFRKRTIFWKEESNKVKEIIYNPEEYKENLDLLKSR